MDGEHRQTTAATRRLVHVTTVPMSLGFLTGQAAMLRDHGYQMTAISSDGPELHAFGEREGVDVIPVEMTRRITPRQDLASVARLTRELRRIRPDIVHAHTPKGGLLGMMAAAACRVPVRIYHLRGLPLETATGAKRALLRTTERIACGLATHVLCVSHSLREVALLEGLCPPDKIRVLGAGSGQGVDVDRFDPDALPPGTREAVRRELGIPEDAVVIGFVGRIVRDKGVDELLRAWAQIERDHPHARLLMVGPFEPHDPVAPETRARIEAGGTVIRVGFTRDLPRLYAAMDVVTLPSWREGFPNVPLEAAAMGLPVVGTRVTGVVDAVRNHESGTLVPVRSDRALAAAIGVYVRDHARRKLHGGAGRQRVASSFSRQAVHAALGVFYGSCHSGRER